MALNSILTIIKKELRRVFTDYRMVFSLFILPPLIIVFIYGLMGFAIKNMQDDKAEYIPRVVVSNAPEAYNDQVKGFEDFLTEALKNNELPQLDLEVTFVGVLTEKQLSEYKEQIQTEELDLLLVFPEGFIDDVKNKADQKVDMYLNLNSEYYSTTKNTIDFYLIGYEFALIEQVYGHTELNVFDTAIEELGDIGKQTGRILGMFLPFLLIIFLMASAMGVGIESVSGEKERGTIATLLVTPIKRSQLAIGKILSVSILGIFSSIMSFVGTVIAFPIYINSFASADGQTDGGGIDVGELFGIYGIKDILMMFLIILVAVLLFVSMVLVVSTFARTLKESNALFMPVYIVTMGVAILTMMSENVPSNLVPYLIPLYNIILGLKAVMFLEITAIKFIAVIGSTLLYTAGLGYIIQKMFKSERIMFKQ